MSQERESAENDYPHGRGYGQDYMRGGEVFGGYGYSERDEYDRPRGELHAHSREHGANESPRSQDRT